MNENNATMKDDKNQHHETDIVEQHQNDVLAGMVRSRKNAIREAAVSLEYHPVLPEEKRDTSGYSKLAFSDLASMGAAFLPLLQALQNAGCGSAGSSGLYWVNVPDGGHLGTLKNGSGFFGVVFSEANKLVDVASLNSVPVDPNTLMIALAMSQINERLDRIEKIQQEMLDFLVLKEKAELRGNLNFLSDILNNYRFNWDQEIYRNSSHIKVLDIKQAAEQKIDFYRNRITTKIDKKPFFHSDMDVAGKQREIHPEFENYQLALYLYSFSSFLDVILLENYNKEFLSSVSEKIESYSIQYRELYSYCHKTLSDYAGHSIESGILSGLSGLNKAAGKIISQVPVLKDGFVDEGLIAIGDALGDVGEKKNIQALEALVEKESSNIAPFVENIDTINRLYNEPVDLLFDNETIYFKTTDEDPVIR